MATFNIFRLAARYSGRPAVPEYTSVTGAAQSTNVAVNDRNGNAIQPEDMIANVFDTSTSPWTELQAKFSVTSSGNIQNTVDAGGNTHTLLVVWYKIRQGS